MKKLLLIVSLMFTVIAVDAQTTPIVTYEVDTTGYSSGLIIPSPFYFHVDALTAKVSTDGFTLYSYSTSSTDSTGTVGLINDSIPEMSLYPMSIPDVDTLTLDGMIEKYIKKNLEDIYGSGNVSKLE